MWEGGIPELEETTVSQLLAWLDPPLAFKKARGAASRCLRIGVLAQEGGNIPTRGGSGASGRVLKKTTVNRWP